MKSRLLDACARSPGLAALLERIAALRHGARDADRLKAALLDAVRGQRPVAADNR